MGKFQDHLNEAATMVELCSPVTRRSCQLQKKKHKNSELVDTVCHASRDAASRPRISTVPTAKVTTVSDWSLVKFYGV
jgi:hypothetical protein